jgi:hypothetical protein
MKAALKKTWENPKWNVKFLPESNKFGVKKVEDGKEWTWRGSLVVDEAARTCTMTCKVCLATSRVSHSSRLIL